MKALKQKMGKNGGFTLVEMLIVVAIIAILIAISIPLINGALERARDATDQANERSAKAEALLVYMGVSADSNDATLRTSMLAGTAVLYDATSGKLVANTTENRAAMKAYGQCTRAITNNADGTSSHDNTVFASVTNKTTLTTGHEGGILYVEVSSEGVVSLTWTAK